MLREMLGHLTDNHMQESPEESTCAYVEVTAKGKNNDILHSP